MTLGYAPNRLRLSAGVVWCGVFGLVNLASLAVGIWLDVSCWHIEIRSWFAEVSLVGLAISTAMVAQFVFLLQCLFSFLPSILVKSYYDRVLPRAVGVVLVTLAVLGMLATLASGVIACMTGKVEWGWY